eukprot:scaffold1395_cov397-Prasinococcus_capsulatus_cf.AAC.2
MPCEVPSPAFPWLTLRSVIGGVFGLCRGSYATWDNAADRPRERTLRFADGAAAAFDCPRGCREPGRAVANTPRDTRRSLRARGATQGVTIRDHDDAGRTTGRPAVPG